MVPPWSFTKGVPGQNALSPTCSGRAQIITRLLIEERVLFFAGCREAP